VRIKSVKIKNLKRFSSLTVEGIPETVKLVVLVGPNGSGKTSFFESFNLWYQLKGFSSGTDQVYFDKKSDAELDASNWYTESRSKVVIDFHNVSISESNVKGKFYFRSAYRNEPDFSTQSLGKQSNPTNTVSLASLMQNDVTVSKNYQRIIALTMAGVFDENNNAQTVEQLRNKIIGKIKDSLSRVFPDLNLSSIGDPLQNGSFYFEKGISKDFHYKNLSSGEKSAFDLILDMIIKSHYFAEAVFCIDEPESHMHTRLQGNVLKELYDLTPSSSQLWISTHSIGMLEEARKIEHTNPNSVVFLDFDNRDFDSDEIITPAKIDKAIVDKFYDLAFGDLASLILPKQIVFCEGTDRGRIVKNFDKTIYEKIFGRTHPDTQFVSMGSCYDIEKVEESLGDIMTSILARSTVTKIIDRDSRSDTEIADLLSKNIRVLSKRHIECYLLDDSVISLLCNSVSKSDKLQECLEAKALALASSVSRGNPTDDIKSASGDICNALQHILDITNGGNNTTTFLRDTMAPMITPETEIYNQLKSEIF